MEASLCVFRKQCGAALAIEHSGDLYSCDHFVYPENRLGNIMESPLAALAGSAQQQKFGEAKESTLPRYCRECDVRFACNGECPKHRFLTTPDGEPGLNYLCAGYKMFFHHIDPYMRFMAAELAAQRAPANVMRWVAEEDARARQGKDWPQRSLSLRQRARSSSSAAARKIAPVKFRRFPTSQNRDVGHPAEIVVEMTKNNRRSFDCV